MTALTNTPSENLLYIYGYDSDKNEVSVNKPSENLLYTYSLETEKEKVVVNPPSIHFFLEKDLIPGKQWEMEFPKPKSDGYIFIPRQVADSVPFSSNKFPAILTLLSVESKSQKAQQLKDTLKHCDNPTGAGEVRACATSLEAMIDFAIQRLGKNIQAVSTESEKYTKLQNFTKVVSCHHMDYPYAVFFCHDVEGARAYAVPLQGTRGTKVKAVAVCHTNTTTWNPEHLSFKVLKVKPGGEPVCHFLPQHNILWTARPHLAMTASGF
uniref:BURP domain-containing protein n=1 Tax=Kalanchoe fedtschenkoi TaxID=63787 RepID=A0A7N0ZTN9_KALFE